MRRAAKVDRNQAEIVAALRQIPGVTVEPGHDDILVGYKGVTHWFEVKAPEAVSKRTGQVRATEITDSERERLETWQGQYAVVWTVDQILEAIGICSAQPAVAR